MDHKANQKKTWFIIVFCVIAFAFFAVSGLSSMVFDAKQGSVATSFASSQERADINNDSKVDVFDLSILLGKWNTSDTTSDINSDGKVDVFDLSELLSKWGTVSSATCTVSDALVNSCRPWLGATSAHYTMAGDAWTKKIQTEYFEKRLNNPNVLLDINAATMVNYKLDFMHAYVGQGDVISGTILEYATRSNTYLQLGWKPTNGVWQSANGSNATVNSDIDKMANSIKAIAPKKVFLNIWHEPENDVTPGTAGTCTATSSKGTKGSPADYVAMWQNVRNRFNALGVTNVVWNMNYMGYTYYSCLVPQLWPGNSLIDWVTFDPYAGGAESFAQSLAAFYSYLETSSDATHAYTSKPWGLSEHGYWNKDGNSTDAQSIVYWQQVKQALVNNTFPRLMLYSVFDSCPVTDATTYSGCSFVGLKISTTMLPYIEEQQAFNDFAQTLLNTRR